MNLESNQALTEEGENAYRRLCSAAKIPPTAKLLPISEFTTIENLASNSYEARLTAALQVLIEMVAGNEHEIKRVDKVLLNYFISKLDQTLGAQIDEILHHEQFQKLESTWRSLKYLVDHTDFKANIRLEILDIDKELLRYDFEDAPDTTQTSLYKHIYVQEYDTPGGEPISSIISNYEFDASTQDIALLSEIAKVSAAAHCPFIATVGAKFFQKENLTQVAKIDDLTNYLERAEYIRWNAFRETPDARYIGLTLPRYLLRLPYGENNSVRTFCYNEGVRANNIEHYLWGYASFVLAANMARSFKQYGWIVNIRGPESGGKVEQLPLHQFDAGFGLQTQIPTELLIPETRELELANLGFIPLSYYKNSDYACFFSANSIQKPLEFISHEATANSRINSRLPYVFLTSRLGHYLKVIQRENIGASKNRAELEIELNRWLKTLITKMNNPDPELAATHPLRDGQVIVEAIPDNPGFFKLTLYAVPHFQIEGIDIKLSLVGQLPRALTQK